MKTKEEVEKVFNLIDLMPYLERAIEQIEMSEGIYTPVVKGNKPVEDNYEFR
jgi:hypothetical protein